MRPITAVLLYPSFPQGQPQADGGLYTSASLDERTHELIVKAINVTANARSAEIRLNAVNPSGNARVITLESSDLNTENSFDNPKAVSPKSSTLKVTSADLSVQLAPYSVNVYRIPVH